jgi:hypothetical protein
VIQVPKRRTLSKYVVFTIGSLLAFLPLVFAFFYVEAFGVNVVARDSWAVVRLFELLYSGDLSAADLWAQHGDHRIPVSWIAMLSLGLATNYNSIYEMYATLFCFLLIIIALFVAFKDSVRVSSYLIPIVFAPVSFMMFSLRQHFNMLLGFQLVFALVWMFSILALVLLHFIHRGRFGAFAFPTALGSTVLASFSSAQGLFVWPIGFLQLLTAPLERPKKARLLGIWSLVGAMVWVVYFIGYEKNTNRPSLLYSLFNPAAGAEYFVTLLGSSLFWRQGYALAGGVLVSIIVIATLIIVYRRREWRGYSAWLALLLFSFVTLLSITAGRANFIPGALQSKYSTFSILAVVSIYVILVKLVLERRSVVVNGVLGVLILLIISSTLISYANGVDTGKATRAERERAASVIVNYEQYPSSVLAELNKRPNLMDVKNRSRFLEMHEYNVFAGEQSVRKPQ